MKTKRNSNQDIDNYSTSGQLDQKVLFQRVILVVASILLAYATFYGHRITSQRIEVLEKGNKVKTVVSRLSSKRTLKTVYVIIDGLERDVGDPIGEYDTGDSIYVYYQPNSNYVVPEGRESFLSMLIFQSFCFISSIVLFALALFYPTKKIIAYLERNK